jgi:hypothetical protein
LKTLCLIKHRYKDGQKWTQHDSTFGGAGEVGKGEVGLFLVLRLAVKVVVEGFKCSSTACNDEGKIGIRFWDRKDLTAIGFILVTFVERNCF